MLMKCPLHLMAKHGFLVFIMPPYSSCHSSKILFSFCYSHTKIKCHYVSAIFVVMET